MQITTKNFNEAKNDIFMTNYDEVKKWLDKMGVKNYRLDEMNSDPSKFTVYVKGNVDLSNKGLDRIPVVFSTITGNADFSHNKFKKIQDIFSNWDRKIYIDGWLDLSYNNLTTYKDIDMFVDEAKYMDIDITNNPIQNIFEFYGFTKQYKNKAEKLVKDMNDIKKMTGDKVIEIYDDNDDVLTMNNFKLDEKNGCFTYDYKTDNGKWIEDKDIFMIYGKHTGYYFNEDEFDDLIKFYNRAIARTKKYFVMDPEKLDELLGY